MNIIKKLTLSIALIFISQVSEANLEVLERPATASKLAEKSVLIDLVQNNDHILAVGERGHVISWQSPGQWQQEKVPVSVLLTSVTVLSDGTKVAVGHDSAIIICPPDSEQWLKVFDGYRLLDLKIGFFESKIKRIKAEIESIEDDLEREDLEFQLEELTFGLEDTRAEKSEGPNKPLLSVAATPDDQLFVVGAYGTLLFSSDKGHTWELIDDRLENPDRFHLNAVITTADNRVYIVGENSTAFVSFDKGATWERMNMPYEGSMFGISAQNDSPNLIAFGLQGHVMVSNDSGKSWRLKQIKTSGSFQGGAIDQNGHAYIAGHGGVVIDFDVNNIEDLNIRKHPSGAAFANLLIRGDEVILVGQYGIISWPINQGKE